MHIYIYIYVNLTLGDDIDVGIPCFLSVYMFTWSTIFNMIVYTIRVLLLLFKYEITAALVDIHLDVNNPNNPPYNPLFPSLFLLRASPSL